MVVDDEVEYYDIDSDLVQVIEDADELE